MKHNSYFFIISKLIVYNNHILLDGAGNWSTRGCRTIIIDTKPYQVVCECDHLTNFASLVVSFALMYQKISI